MIGADFMTPVNATPVDLGTPIKRKTSYATGITIPSSGQVLALSVETGDDNEYSLQLILRVPT